MTIATLCQQTARIGLRPVSYQPE